MNVSVVVDDDVANALWPIKATLGFYIGGMGAKSRNFHTELMARMGFEDEAHQIQDLFFEGKRDEAIMAVPDAFADEISLVGPEGAHRRAARRVARDAGHDAARRQPRPRDAAPPRRPHAASERGRRHSHAERLRRGGCGAAARPGATAMALTTRSAAGTTSSTTTSASGGT